MNAKITCWVKVDFATHLVTRVRAFARLFAPIGMLLFLLSTLSGISGELVSDRSWKDPTVEGLVVVTHGWQKGNATKGGMIGEFGELYSALSSALDSTPSWNLAAYHWENAAATGGVWPSPAIDGHANATTAAMNGVLEAPGLVAALQSFPNLKKVHLIAHSAGTWVMDETIRRILVARPNLRIQLTLLDPFIPDAGASVFGLPMTGLSTARISNLSALPGNDRLFLLENYFTVDSATATSTEQIFSWQGEKINYRYRPGLLTELDPFGSGHAAPIIFLANTAKFTTFPYPSSLDGIDTTTVGWQRSMFFNEIAFSEDPESRPIFVGQSGRFSATAFQRGKPNRPDSDFTYQWQYQAVGSTSWTNFGINQTLVTIPTTDGSLSGRKYRVIASAGGLSGTSSEATLIITDSTVATAPATPTNLMAISASASQINLSWSHFSSNEAGFKIQRKVSGNTSWGTDTIATVPKGTKNFSDKGLSPSTTYDYRVFAYNSYNPSGYSNIDSAKTSPPATATYPLTVVAVDISALQTLAVGMYSWEGTSTDFRSNTSAFTRNATSGKQITVSAPATSTGGKIFQYWLKDGVSKEYNTSTTVTMDGRHELIANYGTSLPVGRTLQAISIVGPSSVDERTAATYSARATYTDGATGTVSASWSESSSYVSISSNGLLDAAAVSSDKAVTITATATISGITKSASKSVTIRNKDTAPTYSLDLYAENGHISASPDLGSYEAGTEVRLSAHPDEGYIRTGWGGDAVGDTQTIYVTMNGNKSVTAHFAQDTRTGDIRVNLLPPAAASSGAGFKIAGQGSILTNWQPSGTTISNRKAGEHTVSFNNIPGWVAPENFKVEIPGGGFIQVSGTYREILGAVQVVITPAEAVGVGARWRYNGGPWQESGTTLQDVQAGTGNIEFSTVSGWTTPVSQTVTVERGGVASRTGNYGPPAGLPIISSVSPRTGPISGGTEVTIAGINFQPGASVSFGGTPAASVTVDSSSRIRAVSPARSSYGTVALNVVSGGYSTSLTNGFSYLEPLGSNVELVGQLGGSFLAVEVQGNYAYMGEGTSLVILDVTNLSAPIERGRLNLPGVVYGIAVANNKAYVANGGSGLYVVDVSTPTSPAIVGFYDTTGVALGIKVAGNLAFVADGSSGLQILNITTSTAPTLVSTLDTPGSARRIALGTVGARQVAAVADSNGGTRIVDVTSPALPVETASIATTNASGNRDVALVGQTLYAATLGNGIQIISISNLSLPIILGSYTNTTSYGVDVVGSTVYGCGSRLTIINAGNPAVPTRTSLTDLLASSEQIRVSGGHAFIACRESGLKIITITNPSSPVIRSAISGIGSVVGVALYGTTVIAGTETGIHTLGVADPARPARIGHLPGDRRSNIAINGSTAVLVNPGLEQVQIIGLAQPANPALLSTYVGEGAWDVAFKGSNPVIVASTNNTPYRPVIDVLNIANPASPQRLVLRDVLPAGGNSMSISIQGNWGYVTRSNLSLDIVDFSTVSNPVIVGQLPMSGYIRGSVASPDGNYLYVAEDSFGLRVVDVTNKTAPVIVETVIPPQEPSPGISAVLVNGTRLFVANKLWIHVYDISNPRLPQQLAFYNLPQMSSYGTTLQASGDYVYVAAETAGVIILKLKNLDRPTLTITNPTFNTSHQTVETSIALAGVASDSNSVMRVIWQNDRGGGGIASGTTTWNIPGVLLGEGLNRVTVTAEDAEGNVGSDVIEITSTPPDTVEPLVWITGPAPENELVTANESVTLSGSASDNLQIAEVLWADSNGNTGNAVLNGQAWTVESLPLSYGPNLISVTASDTAGNSSADSVTVLRTLPDTLVPDVSISFPTPEAAYSTREGVINLSGEASDDGELTSVRWTNNLGGAGLTEGSTTWAVNGVILQPGVNFITMTAEDASGKIGEDTISVTYTPYDADDDGIPDDWEQLHFSGLGTAGVQTDQGNTGTSDFLKFALGMDPTEPDLSMLPSMALLREESVNHATFKFRRLIAPGRILYQVGVTENFAAWDWTGNQIEQIGVPTPTGDGITEEVTVRLISPVGVVPGSKFLRLKVVEDP